MPEWQAFAPSLSISRSFAITVSQRRIRAAATRLAYFDRGWGSPQITPNLYVICWFERPGRSLTD
jgi:hypothetical protein